MNNSFQKKKNKLAQNIMKAKSPTDFNKIIKSIRSLSVNSNHELCSIKSQAHKGQQRMIESLTRNQQIKFYKQRMLNRSKQAKQKKSESITYNEFRNRVNALRGNFNSRVKYLTFNQQLYNEAKNRRTRKPNYTKVENRTLALNNLMKN